MVKRTRKRKDPEGLTRKQIIGLGLIFIFIVSTLAYAAIQGSF